MIEYQLTGYNKVRECKLTQTCNYFKSFAMADANTNFNYIFCISIENGMFFLHKGSNRQQIKLVLIKA